MFELDPRTVIFTNFIYLFFISIFMISSAFNKEYRFRGLNNWITAFTFLCLNFLILSLRNIIPIYIVIVLPHIFVTWAYIEVKRGLTFFYEIKNRIFTDIIIILSLLLLLILNENDIRLRMTTLSVSVILVFLDTVILFNTKRAREKTKSKLIPYLFSIAIIFMFIRLVLGLQWDPTGDPLETGNNLSVISLLFFISNIVIFFTLFFIVLKKILDERNKLIERIESISLTDELTGMMNRRGFKNVTKYEMNRFARTSDGFTFSICDIDHFKEVNDQYGHECGDLVIKQVGKILNDNMREGDSAARWGGEEFVLLLP
ncbi:MAG: GGDEF domain-containing protein [Spirochaetales bacterium]|nr:GGDEF domain-containing protein [Spirochaetales bacterium]